MFIITTALLIIIGIVLFEILIFSHEFGHFITAKLSGVKVNEFALGMGPKLFGFQKGETLYTLRLLPIGGYCAMEGEDEESDSPDAFGNAKVYKRMLIVCAGAIMNILLGLVLVFTLQVQYDSYASTKISGFYGGAYSQVSGLKENDQITKIGNYKVYSSNDISFSLAMMKSTDVDGTAPVIAKEKYGATLANLYQYLSQYEDKYSKESFASITDTYKTSIEKIYNSITTKEIEDAYNYAFDIITSKTYADNTQPDLPNLKVEITEVSPRFRTDVEVIRNGEKMLIKDVDFYTYLNSEGKPAVSYDFYMEPIEKNFLTVLSSTFDNGVSIVRMVYKSLIGLLTGQFTMAEVSGPVGVVSAVTDAASTGLKTSLIDAINNIIYIMAVISINLGVFNMLPVPALDGGRFFFLIIEAIRRKPIPAKYEGLIHGIGFALLMIFILIVSANDIVRLFNGKGLF